MNISIVNCVVFLLDIFIDFISDGNTSTFISPFTLWIISLFLLFELENFIPILEYASFSTYVEYNSIVGLHITSVPPFIIKLSFFCEIDTAGIRTCKIKEILPAVFTSSINSKFFISLGINFKFS